MIAGAPSRRRTEDVVQSGSPFSSITWCRLRRAEGTKLRIYGFYVSNIINWKPRDILDHRLFVRYASGVANREAFDLNRGIWSI